MTLIDVWHAVRRRWLLFAIIAICLESSVYVKPHLLLGVQSRVYVSSGKLLLRPVSSAVQAFGERVDVNPGSSVVNQLWAMDFKYIRDMLLDDKFLEKVITKLPRTPQGLTAQSFQGSILAMPTVLNSSQLSHYLETASEGGKEQADSNAQVEADKGSGGKAQMQMISISVRADDPETARMLDHVLIEEFLKEARSRASEDYTRVRELLERQFDRDQANLTAAERALSSSAGTQSGVDRVQVESDIQNHIELAETERRGLEDQLEKLQEVVRSSKLPEARQGSSQSTSANSTSSRTQKRSEPSISETLADARFRLMAEESIYQPDSRNLRAVRDHVKELEILQKHSGSARTNSETSDSKVRIVAIRLSLVRVDQTIKKLQALLPSKEKLASIEHLESSERQWQEGVFALIPQVYKARILERQAQRRGSLVLIDEPQAGIQMTGYRTAVLNQSRVLAFLPIALFAALLVATLVDRFHSAGSQWSEWSSALEVPVLAVLPQFSGSASDKSRRGLTLCILAIVVLVGFLLLRHFSSRFRYYVDGRGLSRQVITRS